MLGGDHRRIVQEAECYTGLKNRNTCAGLENACLFGTFRRRADCNRLRWGH